MTNSITLVFIFVLTRMYPLHEYYLDMLVQVHRTAGVKAELYGFQVDYTQLDFALLIAMLTACL